MMLFFGLVFTVAPPSPPGILKIDSVKVGRASSLVVSLGKALMGLPLPLRGLTGSNK